MTHAVRLLTGLTALIAAGATFAHTGIHPHVHPHPGLELYLLVAAVGAFLATLWRRWGQPPVSRKVGDGIDNGGENGV